jgi:hypothetical protein
MSVITNMSTVPDIEVVSDKYNITEICINGNYA